MEEIIFSIEPKLPEELKLKTIEEINNKLKDGFVTHEIPINYLLLEQVQIHYQDWIVRYKEYKKTIKLTFCKRSKDEEVVINRELGWYVSKQDFDKTN